MLTGLILLLLSSYVLQWLIWAYKSASLRHKALRNLFFVKSRSLQDTDKKKLTKEIVWRYTLPALFLSGHGEPSNRLNISTLSGSAEECVMSLKNLRISQIYYTAIFGILPMLHIQQPKNIEYRYLLLPVRLKSNCITIIRMNICGNLLLMLRE